MKWPKMLWALNVHFLTFCDRDLAHRGRKWAFMLAAMKAFINGASPSWYDWSSVSRLSWLWMFHCQRHSWNFCIRMIYVHRSDKFKWQHDTIWYMVHWQSCILILIFNFPVILTWTVHVLKTYCILIGVCSAPAPNSIPNSKMRLWVSYNL